MKVVNVILLSIITLGAPNILSAGWWIPIMALEELITSDNDGDAVPELNECDALLLTVIDEYEKVLPNETPFEKVTLEEIEGLSVIEEAINSTVSSNVKEKCSTDHQKTIKQIKDTIVEAKCVNAGIALEKDIYENKVTKLEELYFSNEGFLDLISYCEQSKTEYTQKISKIFNEYSRSYKSAISNKCSAKLTNYKKEYDEATWFISWFDDDDELNNIYSDMGNELEYCENESFKWFYNTVYERIS